MRRPPYPWLCAVALLGLAGPSCVEDRADLCQTDADCPEGKRCAEVEGVKYCVGDASGGAGGGGSGGGTGGIGGSGGTGGSGGSGGTGGVDRYEAVVEVTLTPSTELVEYLDRFGRQLQQLVFTYASGGEQRRVEVDLAKSTSLPAHPVEARLPLASVTETLNLGVEVLAQRLEGGPAVLATGQTTAEVSAQAKKTELTISLSLNPDFDWDLDGDPDLHDCEPDDPNVFHGAVDVCDGVRTACEDFCFIPLEDAHFVRDLACSTVERKCAAVIQGPETRTVRIYEPHYFWDFVELEEVVEANAITWMRTPGASGEILMLSDGRRIKFSSAGGELRAGSLAPGWAISGLAVARSGTIAVAYPETTLAFLIFDPRNVATSSTGLSCTNPAAACSSVDASELSLKLGAISDGATVRQAEVYRPLGADDAMIYLLFEGDDRIGLALADSSRNLLSDESGLVSLGQRVRFIASFKEYSSLFLATDPDAGDPGAYWAWMSFFAEDHQNPYQLTLPPGACPSALDAQRTNTALLLADDCTPALWEVPLDQDGVPQGEGFVKHELRDCVPVLLSSVPKAGEEEAATFVGCKDRNHILVLGRH